MSRSSLQTPRILVLATDLTTAQTKDVLIPYYRKMIAALNAALPGWRATEVSPVTADQPGTAWSGAAYVQLLIVLDKTSWKLGLAVQ